MKPVRLQLSRKKGYRMPAGAVKVSRPGPWGNLYRVGGRHPVHGWPMSADEAVDLFRDHVMSHYLSTGRAALLSDLRGRSLACWCRLCPQHAAGKPFDVDCADCAPCHADILGKLAQEAGRG